MFSLFSPKGESGVWPQDFTVSRSHLLRVNPRYIFRVSYSPTDIEMSERQLYSRTRALLKETHRQVSWSTPESYPKPRASRVIKAKTHRRQPPAFIQPLVRPPETMRHKSSYTDLLCRHTRLSPVRLRPRAKPETRDQIVGWTDDDLPY